MPNPLDLLKRSYMGSNPEVPSKPLQMPSDELSGSIPYGNPRVQIDDPEGNRTGNYSYPMMREISQGAKLRGVDPTRALAIGLQESGLGRYDQSNPLQFTPLNDDELATQEGLNRLPLGAQRAENIDRALQRYQYNTGIQSNRTPDDEESIIQSYNGMGKVPDNSYGGQDDLNGSANKPYGKRILQLEGLLRSNPAVTKIVK